MRKLINAEIMQQTLKLQQLGAKVKVINSKLCYISFDISGFQVQYVYNVNSKGNYFLERIKPYPLPLKEYEKEEDVIEIIEMDIEQFRNALKSHNIDRFIDVSRTLSHAMKKFEDLYLYYNIPGEDIESILKRIHEFEADLDKIKENSERLYFRKEPDNI